MLIIYEIVRGKASRPMTIRRTAKAVGCPAWEHSNPLVAAGALAQYRVQLSHDEIVVYANNSMDHKVLRRLFTMFALFCALICALSVAQGNLWAPLFLLGNSALVVFALRSVMRRCQAADSISVHGQTLIGRQNRQAHQRQMVFPLAWVQLMVEHPRAECRIHLRAHGESMEMGSFLNREQRERLAEQLRTFLDLAKARAVSTL